MGPFLNLIIIIIKKKSIHCFHQLDYLLYCSKTIDYLCLLYRENMCSERNCFSLYNNSEQFMVAFRHHNWSWLSELWPNLGYLADNRNLPKITWNSEWSVPGAGKYANAFDSAHMIICFCFCAHYSRWHKSIPGFFYIIIIIINS